MSLAATLLLDLRANYPANLDRDETRTTQHGLLTSVLEMTDAQGSIISPDLKSKALISQGRKLDVPVMQKGTITTKNVRSCLIDCADSNSGLVRVNWKTIVADICMVPGQYELNEIGYLADFTRKVTDTVEAFKTAIEIDLETALDASKSQFYSSPLIGTKYAIAGNEIQVTPANRPLFFNDLDTINYSDDFYDPNVKVIGSPTLMGIVRDYLNQGGGTDRNLAWQFAGKDFSFSNRITNDAGVLATGFFMPNGSMGLLTRVDVDARMRSQATDGTEWFEDTLPGLPFNVGFQYKSKCTDQSALIATNTAHLTATKVEHWQISFDYAIVTPYNSALATKAGSIRKFEMLP
jgi:hypothetical protein